MSLTDNTNDTSPDANAILIKLLRQKPAPDRLGDAISASNRVAELCKEAIRRSNPKISDDELKLRFIELNYGRDLAEQVGEFLSHKR